MCNFTCELLSLFYYKRILIESRTQLFEKVLSQSIIYKIPNTQYGRDSGVVTLSSVPPYVCLPVPRQGYFTNKYFYPPPDSSRMPNINRLRTRSTLLLA